MKEDWTDGSTVPSVGFAGNLEARANSGKEPTDDRRERGDRGEIRRPALLYEGREPEPERTADPHTIRIKAILRVGAFSRGASETSKCKK